MTSVREASWFSSLTAMDSVDQLVGVWDLDGFPLEIRRVEDTLLVRLPGAPDGFDPMLQPTDDPARFVLRGGSMDGTEFELADGGVTVGPMELTRSNEPYADPPGYGLLAPDYRDDDERDAWFAELQSGLGDGSVLDWDGRYPKYELIQWLTAQDRYIFHGSNNQDIDEFAPVRTSVELRDRGERGNLGAVYGTHDGLWSLFFAVVDRANLEGSIRNGVSTFESVDGRSVDTYQFSVHHEILPKRPFTRGALYVLPRESFRRLPLWPEGPVSNEWASETSVRPLARLLVEPEDFPFLDEVGGHDDGPLLRLQMMSRQLIDEGTSAREVEGGYAIELAWSDETEAVYDDWLELWNEFMPGVSSELQGTGAARTWTLLGPTAFRQTASEWLGELL